MTDHDLVVPDRSDAGDAEAALLGAAMVYPARAAEILDGVEPGDFAAAHHRVLHATITTVMAAGAPPEPVLVHAAFRDDLGYNAAAKQFGIVVHDALAAATVPAAAGHYRRAVITACWRRTALAAAARIAEAAEHAPATELHHALGESLADLGAILARLTPAPEASHALTTGEAARGDDNQASNEDNERAGTASEVTHDAWTHTRDHDEAEDAA
jgi:replicative DNA helicase